MINFSKLVYCKVFFWCRHRGFKPALVNSVYVYVYVYCTWDDTAHHRLNAFYVAVQKQQRINRLSVCVCREREKERERREIGVCMFFWDSFSRTINVFRGHGWSTRNAGISRLCMFPYQCRFLLPNDTTYFPNFQGIPKGKNRNPEFQYSMQTFTKYRQLPMDHEVLLFQVLLSGTLCHRPYVYRPLHSDSFRVD